VKALLKGLAIGLLSLVLLVLAFTGFVYVKYNMIVGRVPGKLAGAANPHGGKVSFVDPFIGTGGFPAWVCAYTFPGACAPFGAVRLGPETVSMITKDRALNTSGYYYGDNRLLGFSHTRLIGTGATDGGHFLFLPAEGVVSPEHFQENPIAKFSHGKEKAFPGYYAVYLNSPGVLCEFTATKRVGVHRYTFDPHAVPRIRVDVSNAMGGKRSADGYVRINADSGEIEGHVRTFGSFAGRYGGIKVYFVARFSERPVVYGTWDNDGLVVGRTLATGDRVGAEISFEQENAPRAIGVRVGISHVSIANARDNLKGEADDRSFTDILLQTQQAWDEKLNLIEIEGVTGEQKTVFYSALYRCFQMPTDFTDVDGSYIGFDKQIHKAEKFTYYTDMSLWDTFRTLHPLYNLIARREQNDMILSLLEMGKAGGYLPRWPSGHGYTNSMLGTPADITIGEAWLKGIHDFDAELAYSLMKKTALSPVPSSEDFSGRRGNAACIACGFCPADSMSQAVSRTLEYAWSDDAISRFARALEKTEEAALFEEKALAYREVWNPETQYFHPRNADGTFVEKFKPLLLTYFDFDKEYTDDYVEGNALQWRWMVPQDPDGLIALFGGPEKFATELNAFFEKSDPKMAAWNPGKYYWHGNEPDIHAAYLFNAAGRPDLTQKWVRWIAENKYGTGYVGLDGNDDGATLSAWYIFSALGFYPIAGTDIYQIGIPLYERATIDMGEATLEITASPSPAKNMYVQRVLLNGRPIGRFWFRHREIAGGGTLEFELGPVPGPASN
jgi:predicted alpha-1,2-mannosidase